MNEPLYNYVSLLLRLAKLDEEGKNDSAEANILRDDMESYLSLLGPGEMTLTSQLSLHLSTEVIPLDIKKPCFQSDSGVGCTGCFIDKPKKFACTVSASWKNCAFGGKSALLKKYRSEQRKQKQRKVSDD